jgi:hypothetical protein
MRSGLRIVHGLYNCSTSRRCWRERVSPISRLCKTGVTYIGPMRTERSPYSFQYKSFEPIFFLYAVSSFGDKIYSPPPPPSQHTLDFPIIRSVMNFVLKAQGKANVAITVVCLFYYY